MDSRSVSDESDGQLTEECFKGLLQSGSAMSIENASQEKFDLLSQVFPSSYKPDPKESQPRKRMKTVDKVSSGPVRRSTRIPAIQLKLKSDCRSTQISTILKPNSDCRTDSVRSVRIEESGSNELPEPAATTDPEPGYIVLNHTKHLVSCLYDSDADSDTNESNNTLGTTMTLRFGRSPPEENNQVPVSSSSPNISLQSNEDSFQNHYSPPLSPIVASHDVNLDHTGSTLRCTDDDSSNKENISPTATKKKKRKPKKILNKFGERITEHNALPNFGEALHSQLLEKIIDREALNKAVKYHLKKIKKKELYLSSNEWHLVCSKLILKYPVLADVDSPESYNDLKYKLQNSITSERSYRNNGIPSRDKPPKGPQSDELPREPSERTAAELRELQQQSTNNDRIKELIQNTLHEHREELKQGPSELLQKYPHYKNADMLLYEFSLIVHTDLVILRQRASILMDTLYALDEPLFPASVDSSLTTIKSVQRMLIPNRLKKNKNIKLAIECKDAAEVYGDIEALSTGHPEQAPFLVVVVDSNQQGFRVISKALLMYRSGIISQFDSPTPSDLLLYLPAAYFILDLDYPLAYNSFLRVLEKEILGTLSLGTSQKRPKQEYNHFMRNVFK